MHPSRAVQPSWKLCCGLDKVQSINGGKFSQSQMLKQLSCAVSACKRKMARNEICVQKIAGSLRALFRLKE